MSKNHIIRPPARETDCEPLFRVVYLIDVEATNELEAAKKAWQIMQDENSLPPVLTVISHWGKQTEIDLSIQKKQ